jgi:hypothetical protein
VHFTTDALFDFIVVGGSSAGIPVMIAGLMVKSIIKALFRFIFYQSSMQVVPKMTQS